MIYIPAVLALSSFALAGWTSKTGSCNTGEISCCNTSKSSEESTGEQDSLLSLGNILDQVALDCVQIPILAVAIEDECKNTPVCCEDTDQGGLIGISCSPLPLI
ncbi:hypothetical protein WALSEDRAFT_66936 [Wallemia mellicola CBS 633.66]|uniref:Hydrophobin n=2 Tax=Wallemia mellicola TaxID=1708541 RepID=A0A4T0R9E5_9BASI|nr:hypothetical protein WALSEDRAFT_66936 [Wallemia mellicola CBS 633.66]EIM24076.1 hypothetical protein WALSEDRAFT_66936 [Wallemia mellicola CBS 633.66]TIB79604.1 hypothetical protein E3Q23_00206 [Wallemia mellicola]TIC04963.1 hypothetical protein E3Q17_00023 [Wallemia mellicola]TIC34575.1 hypothetical protein E3Q10_00209 [Wallemia mellicola]|eukprot:XP_006955903.1 hypothetical protein WALSEDRAFT_66936 [Wallemia mellicola CBS 633.66]